MNKIPVINQIIKDKRKSKKINQSDFAKLINKSKVTVARYDTGDLIPENTLILICDKLNIDILNLLNSQYIENQKNKENHYQKLLEKKNIEKNFNEARNLLSSILKDSGFEWKIKQLEMLFNSALLYNENFSFRCEYQENKFYIKDEKTKEIIITLTTSQAEKLIKDTKDFFKYLLYQIEKENLSK